MFTTAPPRGLRVAELAEAVGIGPDTVRYYERAGLLPPPARTAAGYRAYGNEAVDRLRFIQGCQRLGLRLRDIADLLAVRDTGACPCEPAEQLLRRRLGDIDAELARLTTLRAEMTAMLGALTSAECQPPTPGSWCPPANGKPATGMPATGRPATGREVTTMSDPIRLSCCCEDPDCPPTDCGCDC